MANNISIGRTLKNETSVTEIVYLSIIKKKETKKIKTYIEFSAL